MTFDKKSKNTANKLSKLISPVLKEPIEIKISWLLYEDFNDISEFFNNKLHKHTFYEVQFILEGSGIIVDNNQKEYFVHSKEAIIIPPNLSHVFEYKNKNLKRFSIAFTLPEDIKLSENFSNFITLKLHDGIIEKLNTVFNEAEKSTILSLCIIRNRLCEILYEILNLNACKDVLSTIVANNNNLYIERAKKYINDNLDIILTCKNVADYCHINEIHLNRLFKKHTNETLNKYIQKKKIDYSIELLKNKDLSLSTISTMLGFSNEYHFNTYFKRAVSLPPGTYRNINLKER